MEREDPELRTQNTEHKAQDSVPNARHPDDAGPQPLTGDPLILARAGELGQRLRVLGLTVSTAESCTGGGLADAITDVAGSSDYFLGGVVAYTNRVKEQLLGVDPRVVAAQGAVSEPVALQMAEGVRRALGTDVGVGITGIAGPSGGTAEKPVGLVYIAVVTPEGQEARRYLWSGDRIGNKRRSILAALELLAEQLAKPSP